MSPTYLAFDLEIVTAIPASTSDWRTVRPLGISCAATGTSDGELLVWHGKASSGEISERMSQSEASELVDYLQRMAHRGHTIISWNGVGFDFDILAEESDRLADCQELAWDHVDMMYHFFCLKGYGLSLDKAARGMSLAGKPSGMSGELVPRFWAEGRRREVLDYVARDVHMLLALAEAVDRERGLSWMSSGGRPQFLPLNKGWLPVREVSRLPLPDTSWMHNPWSRSKFTGWLEMS